MEISGVPVTSAARKVSAFSSVWPTTLCLGFGILFVARDPAGRALTLGPVLVLLVYVASLAWRSTRLSAEGEGPSPAESDAWYLTQGFLAGVIFLQMIAAGTLGNGWWPYLMLFSYGVAVVVAPAFRKRRLAARSRHRGVVEDERDRVIQAEGTRWAKRATEALIVTGAALYAFASTHADVDLDARATVAAVFALLFVANGIGQWRAALLYWKDRR